MTARCPETRWKDWNSHGWPVAIFYDPRCPDHYLARLRDLPGCAMQAPTITEALHKLDLVVPQFLGGCRKHAATIPEPSAPNPFSCESMEWIGRVAQG